MTPLTRSSRLTSEYPLVTCRDLVDELAGFAHCPRATLQRWGNMGGNCAGASHVTRCHGGTGWIEDGNDSLALPVVR